MISTILRAARAAIAMVGLAAAPASAAHIAMRWWELGVTPSYGYGDDYPPRPGATHEFRRISTPERRAERNWDPAAARWR
jgi:hypothetical protein